MLFDLVIPNIRNRILLNLIDSLSVYFFKSHLILHMFLHALWAGLKGKLDVLGNLNLNQDTNGHVSV